MIDTSAYESNLILQRNCCRVLVRKFINCRWGPGANHCIPDSVQQPCGEEILHAHHLVRTCTTTAASK